MAVCLWNWFPELDERHQVSVKGIRGGAIRTESVRRLPGILKQELLLENMQGERIVLEYTGAFDACIPSFTAEQFPEYGCGQGVEELFRLSLEADYCDGKIDSGSPLLFWLICGMAWEPNQWERSMEDLWLRYPNHLYAVKKLRRARKWLRFAEREKLTQMGTCMREKEMLLELGDGEAFFLRRVFWKSAKGRVTDKTNTIDFLTASGPVGILNVNHRGGIKEPAGPDRPPGFYFCYACTSEPFDSLDLAGKWRTRKYLLCVKNIGKEPLCLYCGEGDGTVIPPGERYEMDSRELKYLETRPRALIQDTAWMSRDFSLENITPSGGKNGKDE